MESTNPTDNKPDLGVLRKSFRKFSTSRYVFWFGAKLFVSSSNSSVICVEIGRYGINVNRNITPDGMAIRKLNEMEDARSLNPTFFTCSKKKTTTSYRGTLSNPGRIIFLLFEISERANLLSRRNFCISKARINTGTIPLPLQFI
jgi:hypothetical protein